MSDDQVQLLGRTLIMLLFAGVVIFLMWSCDTINYYDPHAGCTEVWVLNDFQWDEEQQAWVVKPGKRPTKLIWRQEWSCGEDR